MDTEAVVFYTLCTAYVVFWLCLELHNWMNSYWD